MITSSSTTVLLLIVLFLQQHALLHDGLAATPPGLPEITFCSSNQMKIREVRAILADSTSCPFPYQLLTRSFELLEPQATPVEISRAKCLQAVQLCQGPVIVEDTSLHFNALNGMPGPYIKAFYESMGNEGLSRLLDSFEDRSAYAECVVSYSSGIGSEVKTFVGVAEGSILRVEDLLKSSTTGKGFGWDPLFVPQGYDRPFGQMEFEIKNKLSHRFKAFRQFKSYINTRSEYP